jgi:hypothetical protein
MVFIHSSRARFAHPTLGIYYLLGNVKNPILKQQLAAKVYPNPYLSGQLRAEVDNNSDLSLAKNLIGSDTTITHDSILKKGSTAYPETTNSIEQVGLFKFGTSDSGSINVSPFQVSSGKVTRHEPTVSEIAIGQIGISEVDTIQCRSKQNSPRQINSSQIGFSGETDINKVSFSSGISFEQVINSNINSWGSELTSCKTPVFAQTPNTTSQDIFSRTDGQPIHSNVSNLLTNIYSTAQTLWHCR